MPIDSLKLANFRSYSQQVFTFSPGVTLVVGANGAGKTNLLESLYVLATTKSWRARDRDLVRHTADWYRLEGAAAKTTIELVYPTGGRKRLKVNQTNIKPEAYLGSLPVVLFEPDSLKIINGAPEERRRWLNQTLIQSHPQYWQNLLAYRRVVNQRNHLLRQKQRAAIEDQVFAWDVTLVELAAQLVDLRAKFIAYVNRRLPSLYRQLAGAKPALHLTYQTGLGEGEYSEQLLKGLNQKLQRDIRFGATSLGPHRDEVAVALGHKPAAVVASRGEVRTLVLALKLAQLQWLKRHTDKQPMLLLDDVFSELDQTRRLRLLAKLDKVQTIITTTDQRGLTKQLPKPHQLIKL